MGCCEFEVVIVEVYVVILIVVKELGDCRFYLYVDKICGDYEWFYERFLCGR